MHKSIMKNIFITFILFLIFTLINKASGLEMKHISITILYDNHIYSEGLKTDWGFSCIIKGTEKTILFDTGGSGKILLYNINQLKVNPKDVEIVTISHNHMDHAGGLSDFLTENNKVTVYLPVSFPKSFVRKVEEAGAKTEPVDKSLGICKDVYSTGEMGIWIKEHSLIIDTDKGLIVITGCAHPGIVDIIKRAKELIDKRVYLVLGGFHLRAKSEREVSKIIREFKSLEVINVGPAHCTGERAIEQFKETYGEHYIKMGVGKVLEISY